MRAYLETYGLPVTITNCSNNYGPRQFPEKVIPLFLTNALDDVPLPLYSSTQNRREWLHVDDHCRAIELVLERGRVGETYNVGSGIEASIEEIADRILELTGKPAELKSIVPDRPGHDRRYLLDSSKLRTELGWEPEVEFDAGLAATVEWYAANRDWWEPLKERAPVVGDRLVLGGYESPRVPNPGDTARKLGGVMIRGLAFLGAALGISLAAASSAVASSVPTFVIKGHGWGHGVGMGQDGAYGYAKHGFAYTKILAHYYPGTAISKTTLQQVRVLLADGTRNVSITSTLAFPRAGCRRQQLPARRRDVHARDVAQASGRGYGRAQGSSRPAAVHTGAAAARARARLPRLDPGHGPKRRPPGGQRRGAGGLRAGRRLAGGRLRPGRSRR